MRIVVVGGTGLIGSALVSLLREAGHDAAPASPSTGVNTLTGAGVAEALAGATVVVDVTNSPSFEDGPVLDFFTRSTRTLLNAELVAGRSSAPTAFPPAATCGRRPGRSS